MSKVDISKATPRPWFVQPNFLTIYNMSNGNVGLTCAVASVLKDQPGPDAAKANAALIVRAVNSYDAMLASLKELLARDPGLWTPAIERARAAIRIAEGEDAP